MASVSIQYLNLLQKIRSGTVDIELEFLNIISQNNISLVKVLVCCGHIRRVNYIDTTYQKSPLMVASELGFTDIAEFLISRSNI